MGIPEFNDRKLRLIMMLAMLVVILAGIKAAADIVVPFLLAVFLAIVLNPLVLLLERFRVPRALGVTLLVIAIVVLLLTLVGMLGASLNEFARSLHSIGA
ncbi:Transport of quorum-sensing signal protein [Serratia fonticola]|uniref:Transport of quorum-sensing signal protein n=1 Tax=Serratia fonticola TaxID=47917 RepID=A0A4U9VK50_SERFO|nr:Transport of quorum-sensing signal protein [Serratia fonticola]